MAKEHVCKNCGAVIPAGIPQCEFCGTAKHIHTAPADPLRKSERNKQLGRQARQGPDAGQLDHFYRTGRYSYFQIATAAGRAGVVLALALAVGSIVVLFRPALLFGPGVLSPGLVPFMLVVLHIEAAVSIVYGLDSLIPGRRSVWVRLLLVLLAGALYYAASHLQLLPYIARTAPH